MRPWLGAEEAQAAADAVLSGWVAQGPRVAAFEEAFATRIGAPGAVATSSCTTALHLALLLAGIGPGDDVIVPSMSFIATANVVRHVGARPVFADVDSATLCLGAAELDMAATPDTRAVIAVDQAGCPLDVDAVADWCRRRDVVLVEDAACAAGSTYLGRPVGAGQALVAFSFHPRKIMTTGEGGMLVVGDAAVGDHGRRLREHGMSMSALARDRAGGAAIESYPEVGWNFRMTDIQAAVGLVQLGRLDAMVERRRYLADRYHHAVDAMGLAHHHDPRWGTSNFQSYWVDLGVGAEERADVLAGLARRGVSARRGIMAAHLEPAYAGASGPLVVTERMTASTIILPLYHQMTEDDQDTVIAALEACLTGA